MLSLSGSEGLRSMRYAEAGHPKVMSVDCDLLGCFAMTTAQTRWFLDGKDLRVTSLQPGEVHARHLAQLPQFLLRGTSDNAVLSFEIEIGVTASRILRR